jgi:hypothetical protein
MIVNAGFHPYISAVDYHADPCPTPSLTQSVAKVLLDKSPLHAWHAHPRLNPDYRHDDDTKFDIGNVAHALLLGRGKAIAILDFDDWRTAKAKLARSEAAAEGMLAVLGKHAHRASKMVTAAREQLALRGLDNLFTGGQSEVCLAWQDGGMWCRQLVDWLSADGRIFADFKTTDLSAAPQNLPRMMLNAGWPIQAAMGERGLDAVDPGNAGRRQYLFVVQETEPPYALNVVEIGEAAMTMGRKRLDIAFEIWRDCITADRWPGYPLDVLTPELPGWAEAQWLEKEIDHAWRKRMDPNVLMAG